MKTLRLSLNQARPSRLKRTGFLAGGFLTALFASVVARGSSNYPAMYLRGTMNNWGTTAMTLVANNTWQATVSLPASTAYQYKYDASGLWTTGQNWGVSGTPGVGAANAANINYTTAAAGNYVFKFNDSTLQYSITPPGIQSGEAPYGGSPAAIPGTIQAENYDTGGQGVAYNVTSINGTGNSYRSNGVDLETTSDTGGGYDLGWTTGGQWFKYTVNVATAGTYTVSLRVASPNAVTDAFHLSNSSGANLSGSVTVPATGGYQAWTTVTASVTLPAGQQVLTLVEDNVNWNINYLSFAASGGGEAPYGGSPAAIPGTIQAENYDTGGQGVAYNVTSINGTGNSYRSNGVDLETTSDTGGGYDLGWTTGGQWFKYTVNVATAGTYTVSLRVASPNAVTDAFHLSNSSGANLSGSVTVPATGGYQAWTTVTASVTLPAGQQVLTLVEDNVNWNINYLSFATSGGGGSTIYSIAASAGANGSISPSGSVPVNQGASKLFTITPNTGYNVSSVTVDGANQGAITSYNFPNVQANHSISAAFQATTSSGRGAAVPYTRYESEDGAYGGGASLHTDQNFDYSQIAAEASNQAYVGLPSNGSYVEWIVGAGGGGAGVDMRFTMPDSSNGMGLNGSLDCFVNGTKVQTVNLTSYYSWQYFAIGSDQPQDAPNGGQAAFKFDEVHWKLPTALQPGDRIRIQKTNGDGLEYGVDFLEIEPVPAAIGQPANSVSVTDFGAVGNGSTDCLGAFNAAVSAAASSGRSLYIPPGTYNLSSMWIIGSVGNPISNITITGAGIWYTNLKFTNPNVAGGGISFRVSGSLDFSNVYMNSSLRSRYNQNAVYKAFMDNFGTNSRVHDFWEEHFECGFWVADYAHQPVWVADGLVISNGRVRNNLADGINFCQGTKNSTVQNCSLRNNGDDALACWPDSTNGAPMEVNNSYLHNTIENNWRASGIAFFGGSGHKAQYNYIKDCFMCPGIRMNTTFPGYHFENNSGIIFSDTTIVNCGTSHDVYNGECGAIDLQATNTGIQNVTFTNIDIVDTQRDAIQMGYGGGFNNIVFNSIIIDTTGLDNTTTSRFSSPHLGEAFYTYTGNGSATFNGLSMSHIAAANPFLVQPGFGLTIH